MNLSCRNFSSVSLKGDRHEATQPTHQAGNSHLSYAAGMAGTCVKSCKSCNHTAHAQLLITFGDSTTTTKPADASGCVEYRAKGEDCGTVSNPTGGSSGFAFSPAEIDLTSPPGSFTATGTGLDTTYGMPVVRFYDDSGEIVGSANASSVSTDGLTLTATTPYLGNAYSGLWTLAVFNQSSSGLVYVGAGDVVATGRDYGVCNPTEEQVSSCQEIIGHWWDYDTCTCVDGNP